MTPKQLASTKAELTATRASLEHYKRVVVAVACERACASGNFSLEDPDTTFQPENMWLSLEEFSPIPGWADFISEEDLLAAVNENERCREILTTRDALTRLMDLA